MGVTVQSAYKTLSENNVNAWMVVQNKFGGILDAAAQYVLKWDQKCMDEWYANAKINSDRFFPTLLNKGKST
jgi:hypothetical protein